jgi:hypothetical protein
MGKLRALILVPFLICFPLAVTAQTQTTALQLGTPIERQLGPGQVHEFTVNLEENSYIQFVVEQRGIDVIVKVYTPGGKVLGEYDSPNGGEGPEHVSFVAGTAGSYRVSVAPLDPTDASAGRYQIKVLELRPANEQELKSSQNLEVVKAKGIALLADLEDTIPQIKSPHTRIGSQLWAAKLLWDVDEKRASKFLSDAITGLKEFLASIDPNSQYMQQYSAITQLRHEIIQTLAARDPDAALSFLYSTSQISDPSGNRQEQLMQESALELSIADRLIAKDPNRTLQIARQNLKTRYSSNLIGIVARLWRQKPEMAAELANEIAAKLLNEKLLQNPEAAGLAMDLIRTSRMSTRNFQRGLGNESAPRTPLLGDDQFRDLLQKIVTEALSYSISPMQSYTPERGAAWNLLTGLQALGPVVETVMPGGEAVVQKRMAELNAANNPQHSITEQYEKALATGSVDASLEAIDKVPAELREQFYIQLANREANNGDLARARQVINDHILNPFQRRQALTNIEQQEINRAMNTGKIEDALRGINGLRTSRERATYLASITSQIGPGLKRATALNLLEQVRSMLSPSPQAQDQDQMNALFEIARAFSRYDSRRAFEILDPLIDQFNELSAAARTLEGFGPEYYEDEELDLNNGSSVAVVAHQMSKVLGTLALTNFERAKAASDRVRLTEVRVRAYLEIADQTIRGK